ncbi:MAG TPA: bifunctional homocysteine S-methyltransferase/methylenetetrahydrofolate reductase [Bacteroidales bacterium]|nr:bifunctional homocysteine S-methyltransferase/methylenetetrahydrofolate reductase [Bacteroidales bacterium]HRX95868.1 bifunctional homocysteine S-methyltransferase/methylenetetrahydrofolate reductase [Bacteroidales bacterium]
MRIPFTEFIKDNLVLFDGAIGTELYNKGVFINSCYDELNLTRPQLIQELHKAYVEAGADVIETNTFGANRPKLQKFGLEDKVYDINFKGASLAREVAGDEIYVAGSIGPLKERLEPWGPLSEEEAKAIFLEQARALIDGGVDLIILETFSDLHLIQQAILSIKENFDIPVIAQMTIGNDGNSLFGTRPEFFAAKMQQWGADVVGINCSVGPKPMLDALEKMNEVVNIPISIMPNAGTPVDVDGRNIYLASADYFAEYTRRFIQAGASVVGGCCGTNPSFIREMRKSIQSIQPRQQIVKEIKVVEEERRKPAIPTCKKSSFAEKICNHEFVTSVEIIPPRGANAELAIHQAIEMKAAGVDAINIPDGPRALSRMGASYLSLMIQEKANMEVILHYACRDRNLLGMVGDLLGAYAAGIKNILLITGDPPKMGTYPDATAVFDVDSIGLTNVVNYLNSGIDLGGNVIPHPTGFFTGVGVNPGAIDLDYEIRRFEWKVKAGAEYAITQPVFDNDIFFEFLKRIEQFRIPILAGVWPLVSVQNAEFMNNEVPGASVPEHIMKRMHATHSKEEARETGLEIARETIREIKSEIAGVQISMPFGNIKYPLEVLKEVL